MNSDWGIDRLLPAIGCNLEEWLAAGVAVFIGRTSCGPRRLLGPAELEALLRPLFTQPVTGTDVVPSGPIVSGFLDSFGFQLSAASRIRWLNLSLSRGSAAVW